VRRIGRLRLRRGAASGGAGETGRRRRRGQRSVQPGGELLLRKRIALRRVPLGVPLVEGGLHFVARHGAILVRIERSEQPDRHAAASAAAALALHSTGRRDDRRDHGARNNDR
jgi:hypothetical protein